MACAFPVSRCVCDLSLSFPFSSFLLRAGHSVPRRLVLGRDSAMRGIVRQRRFFLGQVTARRGIGWSQLLQSILARVSVTQRNRYCSAKNGDCATGSITCTWARPMLRQGRQPLSGLRFGSRSPLLLPCMSYVSPGYPYLSCSRRVERRSRRIAYRTINHAENGPRSITDFQWYMVGKALAGELSVSGSFHAN